MTAQQALKTGEIYETAEKLVDRYNKMHSADDVLHAFAYSAAAQCFREMPKEEATDMVAETFLRIVSDLMRYGPHYGHEAYGGKPAAGEMEAIFAKLHAAVDRYKEQYQGMMQASE